jgi:hypothetical protein
MVLPSIQLDRLMHQSQMMNLVAGITFILHVLNVGRLIIMPTDNQANLKMPHHPITHNRN